MARLVLMICGLMLLTAVVYWPVRQFGVIDYDDPQYLYDNPHIRHGITSAGVRDAFCNFHYANFDPPLATLSFELDQNAWGLKPGPMHAENVLLHLLSGLLLWRLVWLMTGELNLAFVVAAIFLCHPMHVESVAWLAERKDVLSTPLLLGAMIAYVRYCGLGGAFLIAGGQSPGVIASDVENRGFGPRRSKTIELPASSRRTGSIARFFFYALMILLFTTSLFAKAMGVTFPAVLLLMDYWPLRRWPRLGWPRLVAEKLPLLAISVGVSVMQTIAQGQIGAYSRPGSLSPFDRVSNAIVCYVIYVLKLVVPTGLAIFYPHPGSRPMPAVLAALGMLGLLTFFCWKARKRRPYLIVGWLWFLGTLLPVIGLVQIGAQAMADRYSYFPSIGLSIAMVWVMASIFRRTAVEKTPCDTGLGPVHTALEEDGLGHAKTAGMGPGPMSRGVVPCVLAIAVVAVYAVIAHRQVLYWRDTQTLFAHAADVTEDNSVAYVELGNAAYGRGDVAGAAAFFERAGDNPHAMVGLGNCWMTSDSAKAIRYFRKAVALRPDSPIYLTDLANALRQTGNTAEADELARKAKSIGG